MTPKENSIRFNVINASLVLLFQLTVIGAGAETQTRREPPPEAFEACLGKSATCRQINSNIVAVPDK